MARVVKLPSGLIFRDRESVGRRVTAKGTPAGMKGQFGAKAIGQFIDLADKVVSSKAIGAVSSAVERGFEDTPEQAEKKRKEKLQEAAAARAKTRQGHQAADKARQEARPPPLPTEEKKKVGPVTVAEKPEPSLKEKMLAEQKRKAVIKAEADAKATEEQTAKVAALAKAEPAAQPTREPTRGTTPAVRPPAEVKREVVEDPHVKRTKHIGAIGEGDLPVPLPETVTPVEPPAPVTPAAPPGGPATTRAPQPPPPPSG